MFPSSSDYLCCYSFSSALCFLLSSEVCDRVNECNCCEDACCDHTSLTNCRTSDAREVCASLCSFISSECTGNCREDRENACALVLLHEGQDSCENCENSCCEEAACSDGSCHDLFCDKFAVLSLVASADINSCETLIEFEVIVSVVEVAVAVQSVKDALERPSLTCCSPSSY